MGTCVVLNWKSQVAPIWRVFTVILDELGFCRERTVPSEVIERRDAGVYTALAKFGLVKWISRAYGC